MKVVVSGSTGFIGKAVLERCLEHPSITSILILTRRDPGINHPKAKVVIVEDFVLYDASMLEELKDVKAAFWCLGTKTGDIKADIEFPLAFIDAIKSQTPRSNFKYVQLSGAFTEPPPKAGEKERSLWFYQNGRRIRGITEDKVWMTDDKDFQVYIVKPGGVLPKSGSYITKWLAGDNLSIRSNELACVMVDLAIHGSEKRIYSNQEIIAYSRQLTI